MAGEKALTQEEIAEIGSAQRIDKSMQERFAPAVDAIQKAYDAWMAADRGYSDWVEERFENAFSEIKSLGIGAYELTRFIDSALIDNIDKPIWNWFKGEAEELVGIVTGAEGIFGGPGAIPGGEVVSGQGPERINERVAHQKNMLEAILHYMPKNDKEARDLEEQAFLEDRVSPRFDGDYLSWEGNKYKYPIAAPEASSSRTMFLDWVKSLGENGLVRLTNAETYAELENWLAAAPEMGASIEEQMVWIAGLRFGQAGRASTLVNSLATRDADQISGPASVRFEKLLSGETPLPPSPQEQQIAADKRRGTGRIVNPGDSMIGGPVTTPATPGVQPNSPVPPVTTTTPVTGEEQTIGTGSEPVHPVWGKTEPLLPEYQGGGNQDGSQDGSQNGSGGGDPDELTPAAMQYILENFGSVEFFYTRDDMQIDTNGDGIKDTNVIEWIIDEEEENPDVIWGLFQQTDWFAENGPAARQFQMDWAKANGTFDWTPQYEVGSGTWNMTPDMEELLDDTYDSLILEASRLGINTDDPDKKNAIMQMAYNAKQLNMTDFEIKNEFATGFKGAFDINKVQGSGTFLNIKQQLRQNAATYMLKLDEATLNDYAQKIYLGKATYDGINAGHAQSVMDQEPALRSLVEQGYTPSAYFSSYSNVASELLGRPVDFLGSDSKLYSHLKDTMVANDGLNRPMTRGEFERYVRSTPEWDTSENARDEAYGTVGTLLNSFGIRV